jgi:hypothetical protein
MMSRNHALGLSRLHALHFGCIFSARQWPAEASRMVDFHRIPPRFRRIFVRSFVKAAARADRKLHVYFAGAVSR